jgi:hypothetical protein
LFTFEKNLKFLKQKKMDKVYLIISCCLFSFSTHAQSVIFEQPANGSPSFISDYFNLGNPTGIYAADDFEIISPVLIDSIKVYGYQGEGNLSTDYLTGFSLYIYSNSTNNFPAGIPFSAGNGILEIINIPATSPAFHVESMNDGNSATADYYGFSVDITSLQGFPLYLSAGKYWIVAFPHIDVDIDVTTGGEDKRWNWGNSAQSNLSNALWIDPDNKFGLGATFWSDISNLNPSFKALAFRIYGQNLAIEDQQALQVSLYPNPFTDALHIDIPTSIVLESAVIYGLDGKQIQMEHSKNNILNTEKLAPGVYVLKLKTSNGVLTKKVVKQ